MTSALVAAPFQNPHSYSFESCVIFCTLGRMETRLKDISIKPLTKQGAEKIKTCLNKLLKKSVRILPNEDQAEFAKKAKQIFSILHSYENASSVI